MTTPTMPDSLASDQTAELRVRLAEIEETLRAIRSGEVDAIMVSTPAGEQVYSLKGAEQPYREMIEAMSEGAVNITPDGMVLYCNQCFARLTKADQQTIMGSNLLAYFADRDQARIATALRDSRAGTSRVRAHLLTTDSELVPVNVAMHVLTDGGIRSIVIVTSDLTQIVAAQEATTRVNLRLEQANRAPHMLNLCNTTIIHADDEMQ
jgi:PAS domain S-box-containing protein